MSNYKRFITYLFRYKNGEKIQQCGYARVEQKQDVGKIQFYIKNCGEDGKEILPYFFSDSGKAKIPIGKILIKNQSAEAVFRFECINMGGTGYLFDNIQGVVISLDGSSLIAGQWTEEPYKWEDLIQFEKPQTKKQILRAAQMSEKESRKSETAEAVFKSEAEKRECAEAVFKSEAEKREHVAEDELETTLKSLRQHSYPFDNDLSVWGVQAQLRDLKHLPKEYWSLGNNGFVLRGYFNYGSILIGYMEKEKCWFVGVPGVFQRQEKMIAGMFGFDRFRGKQHQEEKSGEFGYWYQVLNMV